MEIAVYGFFSTQTLFVSLTTGMGIVTPAAQAGAKGKGDATSVTGTSVGIKVAVGISVGVSVAAGMGVSVGSICGGLNN